MTDLGTFLRPIETRPANGPQGTISSIGISSDSTDVGPFDEKRRSLEALLCEMVRQAGPMMWIAGPRRQDEHSLPWTYVRYASPNDWLVPTELRNIVNALPDE
jgi:hypothetical protein